MHGGVGGVEPQGSPLSRLQWRQSQRRTGRPLARALREPPRRPAPARAGAWPLPGVPVINGEVPRCFDIMFHAPPCAPSPLAPPHERDRHCNLARRVRRSGMPPLPATGPQAGQVLDRWRPRRRQGALVIRPPFRPGRSRQMDRLGDRAAWRSARSYPLPLRCADAARGAQ